MFHLHWNLQTLHSETKDAQHCAPFRIKLMTFAVMDPPQQHSILTF